MDAHDRHVARSAAAPGSRELILTFAIAAVCGALLMLLPSLGATRNARGEFAGLGIVYLLGVACAAMTAVGALLVLPPRTRRDGLMVLAGGIGGSAGVYGATWIVLR